MRCDRLEQPGFSFALAQGFISSRQRLTDCLSGFGLGLIFLSVHRNPVAAAVLAGLWRNGLPNRPHNRLYPAPRHTGYSYIDQSDPICTAAGSNAALPDANGNLLPIC